MSSPRSPKRRRVLSSINPSNDDTYRDSDNSCSSRGGESPIPPTESTPNLGAEMVAESQAAPRTSKFRFKSERHRITRKSRHDGSAGDGEVDDDRHHRRRRHHESSDPSRPRKHRHRHRPRSPSPVAKAVPAPDPFAPGPLDPDAAFRESLFDAMADDEGAAYWESVYGQPIHVYASERSRPGGELEGMTDEEYATFVRQKMWEKTHAGLVEERERRKKAREERERREEETARVRAEVERSLRKGQERRLRRGWRDRWEGYRTRWAEWDGTDVAGIPWPVRDVAEDGEVRAFFVNGLRLEELGEADFASRLKEERVRWHPDKMQQRLGGQVDAAIMRDITAIFQVIDALWNDNRKNATN